MLMVDSAPKILILCYDNYQRQPRVKTSIRALQNYYSIYVAGYSDGSTHEVEFIDLSKNQLLNSVKKYPHLKWPFFLRFPFSFYYKFIQQRRIYKPWYYLKSYWVQSRIEDYKELKKMEWHLIVSHGTDTLPLAIKLAGVKVPVIFNAHEYYPLEFEQNKEWLRTEGARSTYLINKYLPRCKYMFCVSKLIQDKFQTHVKINSTIITNAPAYIDLKPRVIEPNRIKIIHHGIALKERDIEQMATLIEHLDERYELNLLMTMHDEDYYNELQEKYRDNRRINFLPSVPLDQLISFLNGFDIGYYILPPVNFNTKFALPNKLFEYIQARLCLAFAPSPEMKAVIEEYELGVVSDNFTPEAVAEKIRSLSPEDIMRYKNNANKHALELSSEKNQEKILFIVNKLIGK